MEVNLAELPEQQDCVEISLNTNQQQSSNANDLTEIRLNDNNLTNTIDESQFDLIESASILPKASELPSYNEALRLKKLENNEIPPSYYASVPIEETRITIDPADVNHFNFIPIF